MKAKILFPSLLLFHFICFPLALATTSYPVLDRPPPAGDSGVYHDKKNRLVHMYYGDTDLHGHMEHLMYNQHKHPENKLPFPVGKRNDRGNRRKAMAGSGMKSEEDMVRDEKPLNSLVHDGTKVTIRLLPKAESQLESILASSATRAARSKKPWHTIQLHSNPGPDYNGRGSNSLSRASSRGSASARPQPREPSGSPSTRPQSREPSGSPSMRPQSKEPSGSPSTRPQSSKPPAGRGLQRSSSAGSRSRSSSRPPMSTKAQGKQPVRNASPSRGRPPGRNAIPGPSKPRGRPATPKPVGSAGPGSSRGHSPQPGQNASPPRGTSPARNANPGPSQPRGKRTTSKPVGNAGPEAHGNQSPPPRRSQRLAAAKKSKPQPPAKGKK